MFHTILVSPHHDDVALSVGAMAALDMFDGPKLLVTVFSVSGFAPFLPQVRSVDEITAARAFEDSQFTSFIGATSLNLGWADAPLRFPQKQFESLVSHAQVDSALVPPLSIQIQELVNTNCARTLLAPMGHGGHVDHLTVHSACERITNCEISYYLDQPYAGLLGSEEGFSGWIRILELSLQERVRSLKLHISSFFPSQPTSHRMDQLLKAGTSGHIVESLWKRKNSRY